MMIKSELLVGFITAFKFCADYVPPYSLHCPHISILLLGRILGINIQSHYHSLFTGKTESHTLNNLPKFTQMVNIRAQMGTQVNVTPKSVAMLDYLKCHPITAYIKKNISLLPSP